MATEPRVPQSGTGPAMILAELLVGLGSILLLVGIFGGQHDVSPQPMPAPDTSRCDPVIWHEGMDQRGWDLLRESGYVPRTDTEHAPLYPPGCEAMP